MKPVKLGVIGCGVIGPTHMQAATDSESLDLVAIADLIPERVKAAAEKFNVSKTYPSGDALLDDPEVEAVVLAFPTGTRTALALRALAKGKHVLVEKPVAMNVGEVEAMMAAQGELVCGCCSCRYRFLPSSEFVTNFIASGALGPIRVVRCRATYPAGPPREGQQPPWRVNKALNGGGILVNWGCYDLDFLLGITGWTLKPTAVLARTWPIPPQFACHVAPGSDAEEHFAAMIACEGGSVINFERGERVPAQAEDAWQIIGTKGSLQLRMRPEEGKQVVFNNTSTEKGVFSEVVWEGDEEHAIVSTGPALDLARAIRGDRRPRTGMQQALVLQKITDGIYASAETGSPVEIHN